MGRPIVAAAAFQAARRLKAGGGHDWPPHIGVFRAIHAPLAPEYARVAVAAPRLLMERRGAPKKRRDESRRCRHECPRHGTMEIPASPQQVVLRWKYRLPLCVPFSRSCFGF